jgi:hypothetical protein
LLLQVNGSAQAPPPPFAPLQQGWSRPPQGTQRPLALTVSGAVQPAPLPQAGWPTLPQVPPPQPPPVQVPAAPLQASPAPTQVKLLWSQQPPASQKFCSQHGPPAWPQGLHFWLRSQERPAPVQ